MSSFSINFWRTGAPERPEIGSGSWLDNPFTRKIRNIWARKPPVDLQASLLIGRGESTGAPAPSLIHRIVSFVGGRVDHPYTVASVMAGAAAGLITSSVRLAPIVDKLVPMCDDFINKNATASGEAACVALSSDNARNDSETYRPEFYIGLCSAILGFYSQKILALSPELRQQIEGGQPLGNMDRIKKWVAYIQNNYNYELHLLILYIYSGLWANPYVSAEQILLGFVAVVAGAASIGFTTGMYLRLKMIFLMESLKNEDLSFIKRPPTCFGRYSRLFLGVSSAVGLGLSSANPSIFPNQSSILAREVSLLFLANCIGEKFARYIEEKSSLPGNRKVVLMFSSCLRSTPLPLVLLGYYSYFQSLNDLAVATNYEAAVFGETAGRLLGVALLGLGIGIRSSSAHPIEEEAQAIEKSPPGFLLREKVWRFIKKNYGTIFFIGVAAGAPQASFLDCSVVDYPSGVESIYCPLGMTLNDELVLFVTGNALSVSLATALVTYHARRILKFEQVHHSESVRGAAKKVLHMMDNFQFGALSVIPLVLLYSEAYEGDIDSQSVPATILIAYTFGGYKEQVHSQRHPWGGVSAPPQVLL